MKKKILLGLLLLLAGPAIGQEPFKLWVHVEYKNRGDEVIFIEDLETGTRCYALTSQRNTWSGYGISCVPKR